MTMEAKDITKAQEMRDRGMSYVEIGEVLGASSSTIQYQLNPAYREHKAAYREANREKALDYARDYQAKHRDELCAKSRIYASEHREEDKAYSRSYRAANPEKCAATKAVSYQNHRKERLAGVRAYYRTHRSEASAWSAKRRALKAGALIGATAAQVAEVREIYRRAKEEPRVRCYLCGEFVELGKRHVDHIAPLSQTQCATAPDGCLPVYWGKRGFPSRISCSNSGTSFANTCRSCFMRQRIFSGKYL